MPAQGPTVPDSILIGSCKGRTCSSPSASSFRQILLSSSVPKTSSKSSRLARTPFDTFAKTVVVCKTSSISFSLQSQTLHGAIGPISRLRRRQSLHRERTDSHSISPVDYFVLIAGNLETFPFLFQSDHSNVRESFLACSNKYVTGCHRQRLHALQWAHAHQLAETQTGTCCAAGEAEATVLQQWMLLTKFEDKTLREEICIYTPEDCSFEVKSSVGR